MKTSNKIILITAIVVILFSLSITFFTKLLLEDHFVVTEIDKDQLPTVDRTFEPSPFTDIDIKGVWKGKIQKSDTYSLSIKAPEYLFENMIIDVNDSVLSIDLKEGSKINFSYMDMEITIFTPEIDSLSFLGGIDFKMSGFQQDSLDLNATGAVVLSATNMDITDLAVKAEGAANINFVSCGVTNLHVELKSVATLTIDEMVDGNMTGSLQDGCVVNYYGSVEEITVKKSGFANIVNKLEL